MIHRTTWDHCLQVESGPQTNDVGPGMLGRSSHLSGVGTPMRHRTHLWVERDVLTSSQPLFRCTLLQGLDSASDRGQIVVIRMHTALRRVHAVPAQQASGGVNANPHPHGDPFRLATAARQRRSGLCGAVPTQLQ